MNADLKAVVEMSFATTAGQNLGLDDVLLAGELLRDGLGFGRVGRDPELLNGDIELLQRSHKPIVEVNPG